MATSREELGKEAGAGAQVEGRNRQLDVETADRDGSRAGRNVRRRTDERTASIQTSHRWRFVMGQFYFHIRTGDELLTDDEGQNLPDLSAARREAQLAARELLAEAIKAGKEEVPEAFVIADEAGLALEAVPLATVLPKALKK